MKVLSYRQLIEEIPVMVTEDRNDNASEHKHTFFEFVYVASGKAIHRFEHQTVTISKGDFFLINLNSAHEYRSLGAGDEFRIINCLFLPEFIDESLRGAKSFQEIMDRYLAKYGYNKLSGLATQKVFHDENSFAGALSENILNEYQYQRVGYADIIRNLLLTLILLLVRGGTPEGSLSDGGTVRQIKDYIHKNYMKPLQLSDICRQMNFSLPYISTKFREEVGMTFRDYLLKFRIEKACLLLRVSDMTVQEISRLVGYTDPAFFYKSFRRTTGETPDEYRRRTFAGSAF